MADPQDQSNQKKQTTATTKKTNDPASKPMLPPKKDTVPLTEILPNKNKNNNIKKTAPPIKFDDKSAKLANVPPQTDKIKPNTATKEVKPPETTKPKSPAPVSPKPEKTPPPKAKQEEEDDESLLAEDEGDFFWLLQRIIWGTIKTFVVLAIIVFLIWTVWDTGQESSSSKPPASSPAPVSPPPSTTQTPPAIKPPSRSPQTQPTVPTNTPLVTFAPNEHAELAAYYAYNLEAERLTHSSTLLTRCVVWLKTAQNVGQEINNMQDLRMKSPPIRTQRIEEFIVQTEKLLAESEVLQGALAEELQDFSAKINALEGEIAGVTEELEQGIANLDPTKLDLLEGRQIELQQEKAMYEIKFRLRKRLRKNIQRLAGLLRKEELPLMER